MGFCKRAVLKGLCRPQGIRHEFANETLNVDGATGGLTIIIIIPSIVTTTTTTTTIIIIIIIIITLAMSETQASEFGAGFQKLGVLFEKDHVGSFPKRHHAKGHLESRTL